jgi:hypothetical protein
LSEKRKFIRLAPDALVTIKPIIFPISKGKAVNAQMSDVSEAGVGLISPSPFEVGASVEVTLDLPGWYEHSLAVDRFRGSDKPLVGLARVVRKEVHEEGGFDIGVEFTDIWDDHWRAMRKHLKEYE